MNSDDYKCYYELYLSDDGQLLAKKDVEFILKSIEEKHFSADDDNKALLEFLNDPWTHTSVVDFQKREEAINGLVQCMEEMLHSKISSLKETILKLNDIYENV